MADAQVQNPPTLVHYLKFTDDGEPYLEGQKCGSCGTIYLNERMACGKCFARGGFSATQLPTKGALWTYSIIHRSYPGIAVPFISATIDLDDACSIKGTLIDIEPDPDVVKPGIRVEIVFKQLEHKDKEGIPYVSYFFRPAQAA